MGTLLRATPLCSWDHGARRAAALLASGSNAKVPDTISCSNMAMPCSPSLLELL